MSVKSKLTAIADAIRSKSGSTDALTLDGMAAAIAALTTGGGVPDGLTAIDCGTYTPSNPYATYSTFNHDLGCVPKGFIIYDSVGFTSKQTDEPLVFGVQLDVPSYNYGYESGKAVNTCVYCSTGGGFGHSTLPSSVTRMFTATNVTFTNSNGTHIRSGRTYNWIAWA